MLYRLRKAWDLTGADKTAAGATARRRHRSAERFTVEGDIVSECKWRWTKGMGREKYKDHVSKKSVGGERAPRTDQGQIKNE
jgi:hypothetical protein